MHMRSASPWRCVRAACAYQVHAVCAYHTTRAAYDARCTRAVRTQALGLAGIGAEQEELGTNTIYFGDEVGHAPRAQAHAHAHSHGVRAAMRTA